MFTSGSFFNAVIIIGGKLVGTWKRHLKKEEVQIVLSPFRQLTSKEKAALTKEAERYSNFLNKKPIIKWS